jgi:predicted Zn-dependent protease
MKTALLPAAITALFTTALLAADLPKQATPVLGAMQAELDRSLAAFRTQPVPAYYLSYEITENRRASVGSSFGALVSSSESTSRALDIDLRVGDPTLDNTHPLRGDEPPGGSRPVGSASVPVDDEPNAIRGVLWHHTDRRYKAAVEQFMKVKTNVRVKVEEEDKSADFCGEPPQVGVAEPVRLAVDRAALEAKVRRYTAPFAEYGNIYNAYASISIGVEMRWYVNSEGTRLQTSQPSCRISISAATKADDGMELPRHETFFAFRPEGLPSDEVVLAKVERMIADLQALRVAPLSDPYTGPALLSGRAAGVFFHEVFGHRAEGHRQKNATEGQTFKKQLNQPILAAGFTVFSDPTLARYAGTDLGGHYPYDNQGVQARRVNLVEQGVLRSFLMARMPIEGFPASNGHGRKQTGFAPVARQANLIIEFDRPLPRAALKQQLLDLAKQQGKPYGLFFDDIEGGFTITGRTIPNAFNVRPLLVYRVHLDGREELVRGVDLIGTPLTTFSKVVAADDAPGVFNGVCGAESGGVPVSAACPGLLVSQIEVQKKEKSQDRLPVLPAPVAKPAGKL